MNYPPPDAYPERIHFGGEAWEIRLVSTKKWLGKCDSKKKRIYLNGGLSRRALFSTFLHEFLHAAAFETGIKVKHKAVYALEKALFSLFNDNLEAGFRDEA